jgi:hypothetical protein
MMQIAVIFCETSNPTKRVINEPPIVRITGQNLPDRDTTGRSRADRDYRMDIDPQARLANGLASLPGHPSKRIGELLPWNWKARQEQTKLQPPKL